MGNSCCGEQRQFDNEINTVAIKGQQEQKRSTPYQSQPDNDNNNNNVKQGGKELKSLVNDDLKDMYERVLQKVANQYRKK